MMPSCLVVTVVQFDNLVFLETSRKLPKNGRGGCRPQAWMADAICGDWVVVGPWHCGQCRPCPRLGAKAGGGNAAVGWAWKPRRLWCFLGSSHAAVGPPKWAPGQQNVCWALGQAWATHAWPAHSTMGLQLGAHGCTGS